MFKKEGAPPARGFAGKALSLSITNLRLHLPLLLQQVRLGKFLFHMMDERSVGK